MWECGLKHGVIVGNDFVPNVTPYVGVWIETQPARRRAGQPRVTPYVGVWIETYCIARLY